MDFLSYVSARAFSHSTASALCLIILLLTATASPAVSRLDVHGGSLDVGGTLSAEETLIDSGATLGGTGTIVGDLTVAGSVNPALSAPSPAVLLIQGNTTFVAGSSFLCRATSHTESDLLNVEGQVAGTCTVIPSKETAAVPVSKTVITSLSGSYNNFSLSTADALNWRVVSVGDDLLLTDLIGDSDGNSLPDWYELDYFLVRTGTDPDGHGDSDRLSNWEELIAGTDPTDGTSVFALNLVYLGDGDFKIEWPSVEGRLYSVYFGEDVDPRPTPIGEDIAAQPPTNTYLLFNWSSLLDTTFIHGTVRRDTE